jgi:OOP family OmpA-OmpF porin
MLGVGWNIDPSFRVNLEGRYYGTTSPTVNSAFMSGTSFNNNNISLMASVAFRFGAPSVAPPPPPPAVAPPSFMVFFDWDRSNLSQQALNTIKQAAAAFKTKGNARITATGHTDTSGPEAYNMALSLRRANAVKDALVREGVPAQAITVIGMGEKGLLVQTGDGVREPQNRRVEIVIQKAADGGLFFVERQLTLSMVGGFQIGGSQVGALQVGVSQVRALSARPRTFSGALNRPRSPVSVVRCPPSRFL